MDFNNLFEAIKEMSGSEDLKLERLDKEGDLITVSLRLVKPIDELTINGEKI